jgi:hypothetical protein
MPTSCSFSARSLQRTIGSTQDNLSSHFTNLVVARLVESESGSCARNGTRRADRTRQGRIAKTAHDWSGVGLAETPARRTFPK